MMSYMPSATPNSSDGMNTSSGAYRQYAAVDTFMHNITSSSHHMEKTEAGLKGLYIREITLK